MNEIILEFAGLITKEIEDKARLLDGTEFRIKRRFATLTFASTLLTLVVTGYNGLSETIFTIVLLSLVYSLTWWLVVVRNEKKYESHRSDLFVKGTITTNCIIFNGTEKTIEWKTLTKYKIFNEIAILYMPKGSDLFLVFEKDFFTSKDWPLFTSLIKEKIVQKNKYKKVANTKMKADD